MVDADADGYVCVCVCACVCVCGSRWMGMGDAMRCVLPVLYATGAGDNTLLNASLLDCVFNSFVYLPSRYLPCRLLLFVYYC